MSPSRQREREIERLRRLRQAQRRAEARRRARRRNAILGSAVGVLAVLGAVALLIANIRGNPKPTAAPTTPAATTPAPTPTFPPLPAGADPRLKTEPVVRIPKTAPKKLITTDLIVGKGGAAKSGSSITVNYVGVGFPAGKEFDSSWKRKAPYTFRLGEGGVIKGWDQGLVGMRVGGRRQLSIPSALAYGAKGSPPTIKPNEPLVFVVDLLAAT